MKASFTSVESRNHAQRNIITSTATTAKVVEVNLDRSARNVRNVRERSCWTLLHLVNPTAVLALYGHKALLCLISHQCTPLPSIHHQVWMSVPYAYQTRIELPSVGKLMLVQGLYIGGLSAVSHNPAHPRPHPHPSPCPCPCSCCCSYPCPCCCCSNHQSSD
jgi:hypothetical protein